MNILPEEIKSKIMYSGYIKNPTAVLIKCFMGECELWDYEYNLDSDKYEKSSFYDYLCDTKYLTSLDDIEGEFFLFFPYDINEVVEAA